MRLNQNGKIGGLNLNFILSASRTIPMILKSPQLFPRSNIIPRLMEYRVLQNLFYGDTTGEGNEIGKVISANEDNTLIIKDEGESLECEVNEDDVSRLASVMASQLRQVQETKQETGLTRVQLGEQTCWTKSTPGDGGYALVVW
ncbi:hypothetical protein M231_04228 [Tremella mesenterica]|uniref:Uncharacterized protein n=1 Tax=Tremella mesenterica TaxID=5217 RepID=A0A4Q1BL16_TREME|nr:hypothetical protein M231_04228 [Tremella mesenterica]